MCITVTPCVGVWIETESFLFTQALPAVTPCVGVWIETSVHLHDLFPSNKSHPAWVCGLKRKVEYDWYKLGRSHPAWVCGLKLNNCRDTSKQISHTLRGCVD